jgi:hypothetical protein
MRAFRFVCIAALKLLRSPIVLSPDPVFRYTENCVSIGYINFHEVNNYYCTQYAAQLTGCRIYHDKSAITKLFISGFAYP